MTTAAYARLLQQLIKEVKDHPHREEILKLAKEQEQDDTDTVL